MIFKLEVDIYGFFAEHDSDTELGGGAECILSWSYPKGLVAMWDAPATRATPHVPSMSHYMHRRDQQILSIMQVPQ